MPDELHPRHLWRRVVVLVVVAAVVVAAVAAVPGLAGIRQRLACRPGVAGDRARPSSSRGFPTSCCFVTCSLSACGWTLSLQIGLSELAADALLPGGGTGGLALGAWALHRGGMSTGHIARRSVVFFRATTAANFALVILAGLGRALGVLPGTASLALAVAPAVVAVGVVVVVVMLLPRFQTRHPGGARGRLLAAREGACAHSS